MHRWLDPKTGRWRTKGSPKVSRRVVTAYCPHVERVDVTGPGDTHYQYRCTLCSSVITGGLKHGEDEA